MAHPPGLGDGFEVGNCVLLRTALSLMSPAGPRGRLSVLVFHRVLEQPDPLFPDEVDAGRFDAICGWLRSWFNVLALDDAVRHLRAGTLPERALAMSFDDGYANNHRVALPILERHGLSATFFIATGFLDGGCMWNDVVIESVRRTSRPVLPPEVHGLDGLGALDVASSGARRASIDTLIGHLKYRPAAERNTLAQRLSRRLGGSLPGDLMMTSVEVRDLHRRGMQIGAHTVSHPILAGLDRRSAYGEVFQCKCALESLVDEPVVLFAYPNGKRGADFSDDSVSVVREAGFEAAFSTDWGVADAATDTLLLPRFTPWDRGRVKFGLRLAGNLRSGRSR